MIILHVCDLFLCCRISSVFHFRYADFDSDFFKHLFNKSPLKSIDCHQQFTTDHFTFYMPSVHFATFILAGQSLLNRLIGFYHHYFI